ncbi:MAG: hypothetical protein CML22_06935 [Rheinheimera sp.]|nr:hypothetical protein [Rheinheimera sp.]MBM34018.1 hypothetical protein [Rheinheimera sp.]|tara:strand:+ start:996 stop:3056 length:2061 start_codon:yes stop_codon:yes gene_type:complete
MIENLPCFFGTPFDCTINQHWIEPSQSYKRDKTNEKFLKNKLSKLPVEQISNLFRVKTEADIQYFAATNKGADELVVGLFQAMFSERELQLKILYKKANDSVIDRFIIYRDPSYHEEYIHYIMNASKRLESTWMFKTLSQFTKSQAKLRFKDLLVTPNNPTDFTEIMNAVLTSQGGSKFKELSNFVLYRPSEIPNTQSIVQALLLIFACLESKENEKEAIVALWIISYLSLTSYQLFGLVLYNFKDSYLNYADEFPFLNHSFIEFYFRYLDSKQEGCPVTNYERLVIFDTCVYHQVKQHVCNEDSFQAYARIKKFIDDVAIDPSDHIQGYIIQGINFVREDFAMFMPEHTSASLKVFLDESFMSNLHINRDCANYSDICNLYGKLEAKVFNRYTQVINKFADSSREYQARLEEIASESRILAADNPLDNLTALQALAQEREQTLSSIDSNKKTFIDIAEQLVNIITTSIGEFNEVHKPEPNQLASENDDLKTQLTLATQKIMAFESSKKDLTDKLLKARATYVTQTRDEGEITFDEMASLLDSRVPVQDIVNLILAKRSWVIPSDKLLKTLSAIKNFTRPAELCRYLDTLTSQAFVKTYSEQGSAGAFNHFSKTSLAFKESETTMSTATLRKERQFTFSGEQRLCEAHLKIGVNNTDQEQLRIHFAIDDGKVYLGYIGRHLPIGSY